jgi:hypothetical protein
MTLIEYVVALEGYKRREAMENHRTRMVMTYVKAYAGMGSGEEVSPTSEWPIPYLDEEDTVKPITTEGEAKQLLKDMLNGTH